MTDTRFLGLRPRVSHLLCGVSALTFGMALGAMPVQAQAQDQTSTDDDATQVEEVVVTGIRASLRNAQAIKQSSDVFVDAITAEDIGALPDRSVTEALQRVPGVSISRFAGANDPDHFSVEGSGVIVRGLTFVRSELNGRDTFSANNGRDLSFADVPPELLGSVEVFKNISADMIEGGIAGTVNLNTRKPFDSDGAVFAGSIEGNYGDLAQELTPTYSALVSNRWDTAAGEFGLLLSGVHSQLQSRSDGLQSLNYRLSTGAGGRQLWTPSGLAFRSQEFDRRRDGIAAAAQWRSNDGTMEATLQYLRSDSTQAWTENAVESIVDDTGNRVAVPGTSFGYDDSGIFTNGVITSSAGWRSADSSVPLDGIQHSYIKRGVEQEYVTSDYGFNFRWAPSERLRLNFDAQYVESTVQNTDFQIANSFFAIDEIDLRGDSPTLTLRPPSGSGDINAFLANPANYYWRNAMDHKEDSDGSEYALRADAEYDLDAGWLDSVKVGARYAEREQTTRNSVYNWGVLSEVWNGSTGPVWLDQGNVATSRLTSGTSAVAAFDFSGLGVPLTALGYRGNPAADYATAVDFARSINRIWGGGGWVPLSARGNVVPGTDYTAGEINNTNEATTAAYALIKFSNDADPVWGESVSISGNIGVRYVETEISAEGGLSFPTTSQVFNGNCGAVVPPGGTIPAFCRLSVTERARALAFATGTSVANTAVHTYDNWLPSANVKIGLTPQLLIRAGYTEAIRRSDLGLTRNQLQIAPRVVDNTFLGFEAQAGNTFLMPIKSRQFDLSLEYYFAPTGSLTVSLFKKTLSDAITNGFYDRTLTNGGSTYPVYVRGPTNSTEDGDIQGVEFAYQQFYDFLPGWLSGFGIQANYTYIDSSGVPQENLSADKANPGGNEPVIDTSLLPLESLSEHNANFAAIYENDVISLRLAYSWRSKYLLTTRDEIVPFAPIFSDDTGQLDGSAFYTVNEQIKVGVQAVNLLDEQTRTFQVLNDSLLLAPRSWFKNDRRFSFVVRATF
ncbi:TonB-dependent receptor [Brevundimonas subvibrioides]|uniref:TonB-dependent receptor n=1 Tax=Brevundimonas subvibrioides TaxID=74313 RepID=UPI0022B53CF6|nr:TonB-dependent receptor [Brevundimonas subvibrioides]